MQATISPDRRYATIKLYGQLWQRQDMESLTMETDRLRREQVRNLVLDLDRLSFIDSEGLGTFIKIYNTLKEGGGRMVFYRPHGPVGEVIELAVLDSYIPVCQSEADLQQALVAFTA
jgi:stage II sporulation protein AA (anti-sigma F factor antagonist)